MNYRFKEAIKEELARLEGIHTKGFVHTVSSLRGYDCVQMLRTRTMKSTRPKFSFTGALQFISMLF